jgi:hypothetical protein
MYRSFAPAPAYVAVAIACSPSISSDAPLATDSVIRCLAQNVVGARIESWVSVLEETRRTEGSVQVAILRDICGHLFHPISVGASWLAWNGGTASKVAQAIYDQRRFADLPILADALEDAGCTDRHILDHCRSGGEHVRGCWVVDLLLGKE